MEENRKPIGRKNYGHIPHLSGSRLGPSDFMCEEGQEYIATVKKRNKYDTVIVQEKSDGSNVGVAKHKGNLYAITKKGYTADSSPYIQHKYFSKWFDKNKKRFDELLKEDERACGELLIQAHGTRYNLPHEPFILFDIMTGSKRKTYNEVVERSKPFDFITPNTIHIGDALSIESAMQKLQISGHGAIDEVEGAIWRVETSKFENGKVQEPFVNFLVKYVKKSKQDGIYLPEISGKEPIWNYDISEFED